MTTRRNFIKTAAVVAPAAASTFAAPAIANSTIKWRMQTYAGGPLAEQCASDRAALLALCRKVQPRHESGGGIKGYVFELSSLKILHPPPPRTH